MTAVGVAVAAAAADNLRGYLAIEVCSDMLIFFNKMELFTIYFRFLSIILVGE